MFRVAVLLTVFNRKDITLRGLESLFNASKQCNNCIVDVFMTDDGSTDGTEEAVRLVYPNVHIIKGNGSLYWSGGMRKAWKAATDYYDYDFYIWFNNDVCIYPNAMQTLFTDAKAMNYQAIVCGAFHDRLGNFSYGGRNIERRPIIPNGKIQQVQLINGNFTLIPKSIVKSIGIIDYFFIHDLGDFDYGLRAIKCGFQCISSTKFVGEIELNTIMKIGRGRKNGTNIFKRLRYFYSPIGNNPIIGFRFNYRHFGIVYALKTFIINHYLVLISDNYYKKIKK
jgi:GT2 family glycosyltransferase